MGDLRVFIEGRGVGRLESSADGQLRFAYGAAWLERTDATPLSVSMPLRPGWFSHDSVNPYLWGLLPDNEAVLERWATRYQCSASNVFAFLEHVGADVAGAAQYLHPGSEPEEGAAGTYDQLSDADVAELLRDVHADSTAWHPSGDVGRWSLAGTQSKIALAHDPVRGWSVPQGQAPTTHILKPAIASLEDHDLNELLCVRAAALLGLRTEEAMLGHFGDQRALVVKRYDRTANGGRVRRIHQEDFCQALGVHPVAKYQNDGGPSIEDMVGVLRDSGSSPGADIKRLCDAVAYNWITLGTDAHAKNYSMLLAGQQVRLAPLYDLGSVAPYAKSPPKVTMAQKVGGDYRAGRIAARHWRALAQSARLDPDDLLRRIDSMAEALPDAFRDAAGEIDLTETERSAAVRITDAVAAWAASCRNALGAPPASPDMSLSRPPKLPQGRQPRGTPGGGQFTSMKLPKP